MRIVEINVYINLNELNIDNHAAQDTLFSKLSNSCQHDVPTISIRTASCRAVELVAKLCFEIPHLSQGSLSQL